MKKINGIYNVLKTWDKKAKNHTEIHYVRRVGERERTIESYTTATTCPNDCNPVFINYEDSIKNSILIQLYPGTIRGFLIDVTIRLNFKYLQYLLMRYHTDMEITISGKIYQIPMNHLFYGINHLHLENYIMFEKGDESNDRKVRNRKRKFTTNRRSAGEN